MQSRGGLFWQKGLLRLECKQGLVLYLSLLLGLGAIGTRKSSGDGILEDKLTFPVGAL